MFIWYICEWTLFYLKFIAINSWDNVCIWGWLYPWMWKLTLCNIWNDFKWIEITQTNETTTVILIVELFILIDFHILLFFIYFIQKSTECTSLYREWSRWVRKLYTSQFSWNDINLTLRFQIFFVFSDLIWFPIIIINIINLTVGCHTTKRNKWTILYLNCIKCPDSYNTTIMSEWYVRECAVWYN